MLDVLVIFAEHVDHRTVVAVSPACLTGPVRFVIFPNTHFPTVGELVLPGQILWLGKHPQQALVAQGILVMAFRLGPGVQFLVGQGAYLGCDVERLAEDALFGFTDQSIQVGHGAAPEFILPARRLEEDLVVQQAPEFTGQHFLVVGRSDVQAMLQGLRSNVDVADPVDQDHVQHTPGEGIDLLGQRILESKALCLVDSSEVVADVIANLGADHQICGGDVRAEVQGQQVGSVDREFAVGLGDIVGTDKP